MKIGPGLFHVYWVKPRRRADPQIRVEVLEGDRVVQELTLRKLRSDVGFEWVDSGTRNMLLVEGTLEIVGLNGRLR